MANKKKKEKRYLSIISNRRKHEVELDKVLYFEKNLRQIIVRSETGDDCRFYSRFKDIANRLDDGFYNCHKSFYVNLDKVQQLEGSSFLMKDGRNIPISQLKYKEAMELYERHLAK